MYEVKKKKWDEAFLEYFETFIWPDIDNFGRWTLEPFKLYNSQNGLTANCSEGSNNLFKQLIDRKEVSIDVAVLSFTRLQTYYANEFIRAFSQQGDC